MHTPQTGTGAAAGFRTHLRRRYDKEMKQEANRKMRQLDCAKLFLDARSLTKTTKDRPGIITCLFVANFQLY